jgi:hypothetical protein
MLLALSQVIVMINEPRPLSSAVSARSSSFKYLSDG